MALEKEIILSTQLRQRERAVDNVKRLYAFVLSLSFTNFLREIFETASGALPHRPPLPAVCPNGCAGSDLIHPAFGRMMALDLALLAIFLFTAAIYYFHCDKFLDIRYAMPIPSEPSPGKNAEGKDQDVVVKWQPGQFGWDCLTLIMTVIPFAIMSFTLERSLVDRFGIIPFYVTYIVLLQFSVGLIMIGALWQRAGRYLSGGGRIGASGAGVTIAEERRYSALNLHWILIDTTAVLRLQYSFWAVKKGGGLCGPIETSAAVWFVCLFLVISTLRNLLDYFSVWPFLYLSGTRIERRLLMKLLFRDDLSVRGEMWTKLAAGALFLVSVKVSWYQLYHPLFETLNRCMLPG